MFRTMLFLAAAGSLAFAPAPFPRPTRRDTSESDLKKLQGAWVRVTMTINGQPGAQNTPITITGTRMQFPSAGDAWTITLDTSKRPKTLDARRIGSPTNVFWGVYRLEGDTLTICWRHNVTEDKRPTDFDGSKSGIWYQVYKRQKR